MDRASVQVSIPLDHISVTSDHLTGHLKSKDFFDVDKYPTATFTSTAVTAHGMTATISGLLTVKGKSTPVTLQARFVGAGQNPMTKQATVGFEATGVVSRNGAGRQLHRPRWSPTRCG